MLEDDNLTATTGIATKENILERLNKRNKDRQNYYDIKLEQRNKENLQLEGAEYFSRKFAQRVYEIEARIQNVNEAAAKKSSDIASSDLGRLFADIITNIQELQNYLTSSTSYLTDFKIKNCQNIINELGTTCEETRLRLMPKKKFGFTSKKVVSKVVTKPKYKCTDKLDSINITELGTPTKALAWTISNRNNEYILLCNNDVNDKDISICDVENCFIEIQGHASSVQFTKVKNCTILCGPIARSLFAEYCENSTIALACQQLRLHSSMLCRIYLHVTCRAIIEDCKEIQVGTYNYDYSKLECDFQMSGLDKSQNNYTDIADFNWLSTDAPSPNWELLKDSNSINWIELRDKFKQMCKHPFE